MGDGIEVDGFDAPLEMRLMPCGCPAKRAQR